MAYRDGVGERAKLLEERLLAAIARAARIPWRRLPRELHRERRDLEQDLTVQVDSLGAWETKNATLLAYEALIEAAEWCSTHGRRRSRAAATIGMLALFGIAAAAGWVGSFDDHQDCAYDCWRFGHCHPRRGVCEAAAPDECGASMGCSISGACWLADGTCTATRSR